MQYGNNLPLSNEKQSGSFYFHNILFFFFFATIYIYYTRYSLY